MKIREFIEEADAWIKAGENEKAEETLRRALAEYTASEPDDIAGQTVLLNELGAFYRDRGIFDKGEEAYRRAVSLLEEEQDWLRRAVNYATTLNNLAGLYRMSGRLQMASDMYDAAIRAYEDCEDTVLAETLASVYNNKGLVFLDLKKAQEAEEMFLQAKEILETGEESPFAMGTTLSNLGFAALLKKDRDEAVGFFRDAKELFDKAGNEEMSENCAGVLARLGDER